MTTPIIVPLLDAPPVEPPIGTLLDAARVIEGGTEWTDGQDLYQSLRCLTVNNRAEFPCPLPLLGVPTGGTATPSTTGGTLAAGTYSYKVVAVSPEGTTDPSAAFSATTTGTTSKVTLAWTAVTHAIGYKVYGRTAGSWALMGSPTSPAFIDDGSVTPSGAPPTVNTAVDRAVKTFGAPFYVDGARFSVYGGVECKAIGYDREMTAADLATAFSAMESNGVESAFMDYIFTGAVDLTPAGGAVDVTLGVALLEEYAAMHYAGRATVHLTRALGTLLTTWQMIALSGDVLYTRQGNKVASGGGYSANNKSPAGASPAAGEAWGYVTGAVTVRRNALVQVPPQIETSTNKVRTLVERLYVADADCFKAAIRMKVA
jgi:hypothetical protein